MWTIMRSIGDISLPFFFSSLHIESSHLVPPSTTPLIVCANHSNTILDVAVLASHFPERRPLHFWAKAGFFKNPITRYIFTSSGNIKVDRRNKNNLALFEGTFAAMKAGGAIALFPEGGSYTIPKLANLKMGAAWAALEYSRYLQLQQEGATTRTEVKILPAAVLFDDKSVFRSRAALRFGHPIHLDEYIGEFLSSPPPAPKSTSDHMAGVLKEDATVPATPAIMTRSNTNTSSTSDDGTEGFASPAHRAVARLTADLQHAIEQLTFNAPDWEAFQAVRAARELIFELHPSSQQAVVVKEGMNEYVDLSRNLLTLLTLRSRESETARHALFAYSSLLHLANVDNLTLASHLHRPHGFLSTLAPFLARLPMYILVFGLTLLPTYVIPNALAHHFAAREEESLSSVKTLFSVFFTSILYGTLLIKVVQWTRWSPPGLLVGLAAVWFLHDANKSCIDGAWGRWKQVRFGWRVHRAHLPLAASSPPPSSTQAHATEGKSLFFYGTLVHPKILARVIGNDGAHLTVQNAILPGAKLFHVIEEDYPGLVLHSSSCVKGTLVSGLTVSDLRCLDTFEGDEYTRTSVSVIPDPLSPVETNSSRVANVGSAPLYSILANLSKRRMDELQETATDRDRVQAEVYRWTAGEERLQKERVWEFDQFAREKAHNWVGEGEVEHEHEYQLVDAIHSTTTATTTSTITASTPHRHTFATSADDEDESAWIEKYAAVLVPEEDRIREAVVKVFRQLREKPSIQFYVDKAFHSQARTKRPNLGDPQLLSALFRAREGARRSLELLFRSVERNEEAHEPVARLVQAKMRALARTPVPAIAHEGGAKMWPFTEMQVRSYATLSASADESRKTV